jgi:chorismate mutase
MNLLKLRSKLDRLNRQIVGRLADRSRLAHNAVIYRPGGIDVSGQGSFLDYSLRGLEQYHASLGRYSYPDQAPLHGDVPPQSPVAREVRVERLPTVTFPVALQVQDYYLGLLPFISREGDDPQSYGEAVYIDADIILLMHERINVGRYVAEVKMRTAPEIAAFEQTRLQIRADLTDPAREQQVIDTVRQLAGRLELDPDVIARLFRWMIDRTTDLEVLYIEQLRGEHS